MKDHVTILQRSLVIAVILLVGIAIIGSIANLKVAFRETETCPPQGKLVDKSGLIGEFERPSYQWFPQRPYTQALYEDEEEENKGKTSILQRPRILEVKGHPFRGNVQFQMLTEPVRAEEDAIVHTPFDFTQQVVLFAREPDKEESSWRSHYEPYTLDQLEDPGELQNHLLCFVLHIPNLYQNASFSFPLHQIVVLDSDGQTPLPYWVQDDYHQDMLLWTRLPVYNPAQPKTLYIGANQQFEYPMLDATYPFSNFDSVFTKQETNITGQYQFRYNKVASYLEALDVSGNHRNGTISTFSWGENYGGSSSWSWFEEYKKLYFSEAWRSTEKTYCTIPNPKESVLSAWQGSLEMIIDYRDGYLSNLGRNFGGDEEYSDQKAVFFEDTNGNFSIYCFQGAFYWEFAKNHQAVKMKIPFSEKLLQDDHPLAHLFCTWDQSLQRYDFYLDGQKQENVTITSIPKPNSSALGDLIIGSSSNDTLRPSSFFPSVYFYDCSFDTTKVVERTQKHWHQQNPLLFSQVGNSVESVEKSTPDFDGIQYGNALYYDLFYVAPVHAGYYGSNYYGTSVKGREVNVLFNENTNWQPVFGMPNHFYSYVGTYIEVKQPCMVEYVKVKIINPALIEELCISFSYTSHMSFVKEDSQNFSFGTCFDWLKLVWEKLLPSAAACGPFYSHKDYGETSLELVSSVGDSYIYRLKEPIYIDEEADFMQMQYTCAKKVGRFSLQLEDVFVFSEGQYSKGVYAPDIPMKYSHPYTKEWNEEKQTFEIDMDGDTTMLLYSDFQVLLLGQEKGLIPNIVVQNKGKELAFVLMNEGSEPITITEESLLSIQMEYRDEKWVGLWMIPVLKDGPKDTKNSIEILLPFENLLWQTIQPGESITFPFFNWNQYKRKPGFRDATSIVFNKVKTEGEISFLPVISKGKMKILQWEEDFWGYDRSWGVSFMVDITPHNTLEIKDPKEE
jgi:hypothetical protein